MEELYLQFEQLRDIITGRKTYSNDDEWEANILAQMEIVDDLVESVHASVVDCDLLD